MFWKMRFVNLAVIFTMLAGILAGCGTSSPTPAPAPPQVDISVSPSTQIMFGAEASITTSTSDNITSYEWTAIKGKIINPTASSVIYTAPQEAGQDIVTLVVTGSTGKITKSINLTIILPASTNTPPPTPSIPTSSATLTGSSTGASEPSSSECKGNSTQEYVSQAFAAQGGNNYQKVLACAQGAIGGWTAQADTQQANRIQQNICTKTPDPKDENAKAAYWKEYWAVNDVGTAWFLKGEAYSGLQDWQNARKAYHKVIDSYSCAYSWDNNGWFWRVLDGANKSLNAIKDK